MGESKATGNDVAKAPVVDTSLPARTKLPEKLQTIVDNAEQDESLYDEIWDGT